jgi:hypothetical protein
MALVLFALFMVIFTRIGWWAFEYFHMSVDRMSFFLGVILTMLSGFVVFRLREWYTAATRPRRPQTVTLQTNDTPAQITGAALGAILGMICTIGAMLLAAYIAIFVLP